MAENVPNDPPNKTRKLMVLTFNKADFVLYEDLLAAAQEKLPDLTLDGLCSMVLTDFARCQREKVPTPIRLPE